MPGRIRSSPSGHNSLSQVLSSQQIMPTSLILIYASIIIRRTSPSFIRDTRPGHVCSTWPRIDLFLAGKQWVLLKTRYRLTADSQDFSKEEVMRLASLYPLKTPQTYTERASNSHCSHRSTIECSRDAERDIGS